MGSVVRELYFPVSLEKINFGAFESSDIVRVHGGFGISYIGERAFYESRLENFEIHSSFLEVIQFRTFANTRLRCITLPSSLRYICVDSFYRTSIRVISFVGSVPQFTRHNMSWSPLSGFNGVSDLGAIKVWPSRLEEFRNALYSHNRSMILPLWGSCNYWSHMFSSEYNWGSKLVQGIYLGGLFRMDFRIYYREGCCCHGGFTDTFIEQFFISIYLNYGYNWLTWQSSCGQFWMQFAFFVEISWCCCYGYQAHIWAGYRHIGNFNPAFTLHFFTWNK